MIFAPGGSFITGFVGMIRIDDMGRVKMFDFFERQERQMGARL